MKKRQRQTKAEKWNGKTIEQLAESESNVFIARYSKQALEVARLVVKKIKANQRK